MAQWSMFMSSIPCVFPLPKSTFSATHLARDTARIQKISPNSPHEKGLHKQEKINYNNYFILQVNHKFPLLSPAFLTEPFFAAAFSLCGLYDQGSYLRQSHKSRQPPNL